MNNKQKNVIERLDDACVDVFEIRKKAKRIVSKCNSVIGNRNTRHHTREEWLKKRLYYRGIIARCDVAIDYMNKIKNDLPVCLQDN